MKKFFNVSNVGIAITVIYIGFIAWVRWPFSVHTLSAIPINVLGDFLAGVFGPLMLLWLILGFMLQRKELGQNTAALQLQADELKKSVEQHKELVKVTREQLENENYAIELKRLESLREIEPTFKVENIHSEQFCHGEDPKKIKYKSFRFEIVNGGSAAYKVKFSSDPKIQQIDDEKQIEYFPHGEIFNLHWNEEKSGKAPIKFKFSINCLDSNARAYKSTFEFYMKEEKYICDSASSESYCAPSIP